MWIMQAPVISTGHLSPATLKALVAGGGIEIHAVQFPEGPMVFCSDEVEMEGYPEDLIACLTWNIRQGYEWLRFDSDGDWIAGLPKYEHR